MLALILALSLASATRGDGARNDQGDGNRAGAGIAASVGAPGRPHLRFRRTPKERSRRKAS